MDGNVRLVSSFFSDFLKWKIWAFIGASFLVLLGLLKISSVQNEAKEKEISSLEEDIKVVKEDAKVDVVNAQNETAYQEAKERLEDEAYRIDVTLPYTLD